MLDSALWLISFFPLAFFFSLFSWFLCLYHETNSKYHQSSESKWIRSPINFDFWQYLPTSQACSNLGGCLYFQLLEAACTPWLVVTFLMSLRSLLWLSLLLHWLWPSCLSYKDSCDYIGSLWIIQENIPTTRSLITSVTPLLLYKVTYL